MLHPDKINTFVQIYMCMKQITVGIDIGGTNTAIGFVDREGNGKRWFKFAADKDVEYKVAADAEFSSYSLIHWGNGIEGNEVTAPTVRSTEIGPFDEDTEVLVCIDESSLEENAENFMIAMVESNYDPDFGIEDSETHKRYSYDLSVQAGDTLNLKVQSLEGQEIVYCVWTNSKGEILQKGDKDNYSTTITSVSDVCCYAFDKYFNYDSMYYQFTVDNNFSAQAKDSNMVFVKPAENSIDLEVTATATDMSKITYKWYYDDEDYQPVYIGEAAKVTVEKPF